jgi:hypothetical protein
MLVQIQIPPPLASQGLELHMGTTMPSWQDFLFVTLCYGKQIEVLHVFFEN